MSNGFEVDEEGFKGLDHDAQMRAIFKNVYTIKTYMLEQPEKCQTEMTEKIKNNNKMHRRINFGIGSGGGISVVAAFEIVRRWLS